MCRVEKLDNLKTNTRPKSNKIYIKNANTESINCKADGIVSYCAYCKTLVFLQALHENF